VSLTDDAFLGGRVRLLQPSSGYRTNQDSVLLAAFAHGPRPARLVVDLGAGVGPLAIFLLMTGAARRALLVERDEAAAELARQNLARNGLADRAEVLVADVQSDALPRAGCDLVVCNPPYTEPGRGRVARGSKAAARAGRLDAFTRAAARVLGRRGAACFVYPARELVRLQRELSDVGLQPKVATFVHATADRAARVVMVRAKPGNPGGLEVTPPIVER